LSRNSIALAHLHQQQQEVSIWVSLRTVIQMRQHLGQSLMLDFIDPLELFRARLRDRWLQRDAAELDCEIEAESSQQLGFCCVVHRLI
jgi:hypothetical protein